MMRSTITISQVHEVLTIAVVPITDITRTARAQREEVKGVPEQPLLLLLEQLIVIIIPPLIRQPPVCPQRQ